MIHFLHGLFGSSDDWSFLAPKQNQAHCWDLHKSTFDDMLYAIESGDTLIGYSLGGRVALLLAKQLRQRGINLRKVVLMSSHPGLHTDEVDKRYRWEEEIIIKFNSLLPDAFASYWNGLSLFSCTTVDIPSRAFLAENAKLFQQYRLSHNAGQYDFLKANPDLFLWIYGTEDKKYHELITQRVLPLGIKVCGVRADHRVLQNENAIKSILQREGLI